MSMIDVNFKPDRATLRQFGWISLVAFAALGGLTWYTHKFLLWSVSPSAAQTTAYVLWVVAGVSAVLALIAPGTLRPLYVALMLIALPIGFVLSHVIMAILYYAIFTPVGLFMRLIGRDALERRFDRQARSYWVPRPTNVDPKRYFRQF
jgi:protein-S-isoprenylcysteine O-methyltransferase Ste14